MGRRPQGSEAVPVLHGERVTAAATVLDVGDARQALIGALHIRANGAPTDPETCGEIGGRDAGTFLDELDDALPSHVPSLLSTCEARAWACIPFVAIYHAANARATPYPDFPAQLARS